MTEPTVSSPAGRAAPMRRWRLSHPGRPATGPGAWLSRAPWIVLAASVVFFVLAALWPLPDPPIGEAAAPPAIPRVPEQRTPVADRERALASLTTHNFFAADGEFWLAQPVVAEGEQSPDGAVPVPGGQPAGAPPVVLTRPEEMSPDIKPAFDNLRLAGVRVTPEGISIAMILCASDLTTLIQRTAGEDFVDKQNPQAPWRIIEIDTVHDRVVLERSGKRVSLALYASEPVPVAVAPVPEIAPGPASKYEVVRASEADIIRDLRAAGISETDIAALTELMRKDPEAFARAKAEAIGSAAAQEQPTGIGEVLKLMQQAADQKEAPPAKDAPPQPPPPQS